MANTGFEPVSHHVNDLYSLLTSNKILQFFCKHLNGKNLIYFKNKILQKTVLMDKQETNLSKKPIFTRIPSFLKMANREDNLWRIINNSLTLLLTLSFCSAIKK